MEARHKPKSEIERLLDYFQSDGDALHALQNLDLSQIPGLSFMSMITYEGVPIVPPVVTPLRREDVLCYKRQAMLAETQIRLRARQKLLEKIQTVMDEIDKTHGNGPAKSTDDFSHTAVGDSPKSSAVNLDVEANKVDSGIGTDTIGRCNGATAEDFSVIHATNDVRSGDGAETGAQRMDDSDLSDHASQGLIMLRQNLERNSSRGPAVSPQPPTLRSDDDVGAARFADGLITANMCESLPSVHVQRTDRNPLRDSINSDSKLSELQRHHPAASKRLPTFLRIQESLTRKLNATAPGTSSQTSFRESAERRDDARLGATYPGGDTRSDNALVMQQLASMTQQLSANKQSPPAAHAEATHTSARHGVTRSAHDSSPAADAGTHSAPGIAAGGEHSLTRGGSVGGDKCASAVVSSGEHSDASEEQQTTVISQQESKNANSTWETVQTDESYSSAHDDDDSESRAASCDVTASQQLQSAVASHAVTMIEPVLHTPPQSPASVSSHRSLCDDAHTADVGTQLADDASSTLPSLLSRVVLNVDTTPDRHGASSRASPSVGDDDQNKAEQFLSQSLTQTYLASKRSQNSSVDHGNIDPFKRVDLIERDPVSSSSGTVEATCRNNTGLRSPVLQLRPDQEGAAAPVDMQRRPDVTTSPASEGCSTSADTQELFAQNSELAQDLKLSLDTMQHVMTSLPQLMKQAGREGDGGGVSASPSALQLIQQLMTPHVNTPHISTCTDADADAAATADDAVAAEENAPNLTPNLKSSYTLEQPSPALVAANPRSLTPNLKSSYTLEQPSPALVAANPQDVSLTSPCSASQTKQRNGSKSETELLSSEARDDGSRPGLTCSMEDLRIRPAQRKLKYDHLPATASSLQKEPLSRPDPESEIRVHGLSDDVYLPRDCVNVMRDDVERHYDDPLPSESKFTALPYATENPYADHKAYQGQTQVQLQGQPGDGNRETTHELKETDGGDVGASRTPPHTEAKSQQRQLPSPASRDVRAASQSNPYCEHSGKQEHLQRYLNTLVTTSPDTISPLQKVSNFQGHGGHLAWQASSSSRPEWTQQQQQQQQQRSRQLDDVQLITDPTQQQQRSRQLDDVQLITDPTQRQQRSRQLDDVQLITDPTQRRTHMQLLQMLRDDQAKSMDAMPAHATDAGRAAVTSTSLPTLLDKPALIATLEQLLNITPAARTSSSWHQLSDHAMSSASVISNHTSRAHTVRQTSSLTSNVGQIAMHERNGEAATVNCDPHRTASHTNQNYVQRTHTQEPMTSLAQQQEYAMHDVMTSQTSDSDHTVTSLQLQQQNRQQHHVNTSQSSNQATLVSGKPAANMIPPQHRGQDVYIQDGSTLSQVSSLPHDYTQRPHTAPQLNHSIDTAPAAGGGAGAQQDMYLSPAAIVQLLSSAGLNISLNTQQTSESQDQPQQQLQQQLLQQQQLQQQQLQQQQLQQLTSQHSFLESLQAQISYSLAQHQTSHASQHQTSHASQHQTSHASQHQTSHASQHQTSHASQHQTSHVHLQSPALRASQSHGAVTPEKGLDVSLTGSEKSVHFATPVHTTAFVSVSDGYLRIDSGDNDVVSGGECNRDAQLETLSRDLHRRFVKLTALVKGYLTRRLYKTEKVQSIIKSIADTAEFAVSLQRESPMKRGVYSEQDRRLQQRVITQINTNLLDIHDIFIRSSAAERMELIAQDRAAQRERLFKSQVALRASEKRLSAATVKSMERKQKAMLAEASVPHETRPKSAPPATSVCHKNDKETAAIKRHYQVLFNKALKPHRNSTSPIKPIKNTNRVQHKDPNIRATAAAQQPPPRKTHVQARTTNTARNKAKQTVTSTPVKKTSQSSARIPVRKVSRQANNNNNNVKALNGQVNVAEDKQSANSVS